MKGYIQINVKYANKVYRRPVNQCESDSLMTNKVHGTYLMCLVFLNLKKVGNLSLITFCHIEQLTSISKSLHLNVFNSFLSLPRATNKHALTYNQNEVLMPYFRDIN